MESYIKYTEDGEEYTKDFDGLSLDTMFCEAARMYAFDDCSDMRVTEIVYNGEHYEYDGWLPNMTFAFCNSRGEVVWERSFPSWDH